MRLPVCLAAVLALTAFSARGDGLLYQLPKDGTWASYECDTTPKVGERLETTKGSIRLASVGTTTEQGKSCRWIEVVVSDDRTGDREARKRTTFKVLIPEEQLGKGKTPLDHVVRAWIRRRKSAPKILEYPKDLDTGVLLPVLAPPLENAKQLEKKTVSSKLGELSCSGVTGTSRFADDDGRNTFDVTFETRLHSKSPFGVVVARWEFERVYQNGETEAIGTMNLKLSDFGDNAKSELLDQQ